MPGQVFRHKVRRILFLVIAFVVCLAVSLRKEQGPGEVKPLIRRPLSFYIYDEDGEETDTGKKEEPTIHHVKTSPPILPAPTDAVEISSQKGEETIEATSEAEVVHVPTQIPHQTTTTKHIHQTTTTKHVHQTTTTKHVHQTTTKHRHQTTTTTAKHMILAATTTASSATNTSEKSKEIEECTPPAYHEFPPDLFTHKQRSHGAVIVHILVIVYMFYAVAVVCDDYFIASLEECCSRLQLSEDVAGATFMAAGSSAPELFTAILGVLVAKGDVGTGTIVGSAVFNVLFVIGICGIFAGRVVELTWWPLFRDSIFYAFTVIILIVVIIDSEITWYESVIMMSIYSLYIILMKYSNQLRFWFSRRLGIEDDDLGASSVGILGQNDKKNYSSYVPFNNEIDECAVSGTARFHSRVSGPPADEAIRDGNYNRMSLYDAALRMLMKRQFPPKTRFRAAAHRIMLEHERRQKDQSYAQQAIQAQISLDSGEPTKLKTKSSNMGITSDKDWRRIPSISADGPLGIARWIVETPLVIVLHFTIPDCREDRWRRFFMLTFVMSITWTAVFSYVMVWMVTLVGYTLGIPDSIMGITFLAAGTSVPDAFASLIVAKQGQGDMAVSNSIGSNVFDILIGLAFPWFIQTTIVEPGSIATINSRGMVYSVVLLFLTIIVTIAGIYFSHWQLTPRLGYVLLTVYGLFLVVSILLEYNLLGYVNPPMCPD